MFDDLGLLAEACKAVSFMGPYYRQDIKVQARLAIHGRENVAVVTTAQDLGTNISEIQRKLQKKDMQDKRVE